MRNWNARLYRRTGQLRLFSAYIWGIETHLLPHNLKKPFRFQPTYEELKHFFRFHSSSPFCRFSAYLWGIETQARREPYPGRKESFQPTYEELKLKETSGRYDVRKSFQPSYEELKPVIVCFISQPRQSFSAYLWGIETTSSYTSFGFPFYVFSLPMRNWNFFCVLNVLISLAQFSAYLWGIETIYKANIAFFFPKRVFSLPMRNWNQKI